MSPCSSRWSWLKFVKAATSYTAPSTRCCASAWLETSIEHTSTPRSRMAASRPCSSGASGVVRTLGTRWSATRISTVPTRPVVRPAARRTASRRYVVVVLPFVPVTPISCRSRAGEPYTCADTAPRTARGSATTTAGSVHPWPTSRRAPSRSVTTATAPDACTAAAKSAPCARAPGSAAYRSPGRTERESRVTPVTWTATADGSSAVRSAPAASATDAREQPGFVEGLRPAGVVPAGPGTASRLPVTCGDRDLGRGRAGGRDLQLLQCVRRDVGEHRSRHDTAVVAVGRPLQGDGDDQLGVVGGRNADERAGVALVAAALGVDALRRTRLARHPVALDPGLRRRPLGADHPLEHGPQGPRRIWAHHAHLLRSRRLEKAPGDRKSTRLNSSH